MKKLILLYSLFFFTTQGVNGQTFRQFNSSDLEQAEEGVREILKYDVTKKKPEIIKKIKYDNKGKPIYIESYLFGKLRYIASIDYNDKDKVSKISLYKNNKLYEYTYSYQPNKTLIYQTINKDTLHYQQISIIDGLDSIINTIIVHYIGQDTTYEEVVVFQQNRPMSKSVLMGNDTTIYQYEYPTPNKQIKMKKDGKDHFFKMSEIVFSEKGGVTKNSVFGVTKELYFDAEGSITYKYIHFSNCIETYTEGNELTETSCYEDLGNGQSILIYKDSKSRIRKKVLTAKLFY